MNQEPAAYTDPSSWIITQEQLPQDLWPVIRDSYIIPLQTLWHTHGIGLVPSARSVYRPKEYELSRGRLGGSLHTFPPGTRGAADLTTHDGGEVIYHLDSVIEVLPFRRICYYGLKNFIHVDYGDQGRRSGDRRSLWYCSGPGAPWQFQSWLPEIS